MTDLHHAFAERLFRNGKLTREEIAVATDLLTQVKPEYLELVRACLSHLPVRRQSWDTQPLTSAPRTEAIGLTLDVSPRLASLIERLLEKRVQV